LQKTATGNGNLQPEIKSSEYSNSKKLEYSRQPNQSVSVTTWFFKVCLTIFYVVAVVTGKLLKQDGSVHKHVVELCE